MRKFFSTDRKEKLLSIIFLIIVALLLSADIARGQTVKQDSKGNYYSAPAKEKKQDTKTGAIYTDSKGLKYDVYKGAKGGLYYWKTSAKGTRYKVYLKKGGDDK